MRVIAGTFRSRPLLAPQGMATRPTADRLRETLFNVLTNGAVNRIANARFLDLFAGSGAVGIEALSRGAVAVTFVEQSAGALTALRRNLDSLGIKTGFSVQQKSVAKFLAAPRNSALGEFDTIFLDPPYDSCHEYAETLNALGAAHNLPGNGVLMSPGALVVAEHKRKSPLQDRYSDLSRIRVLEQGDAALSFYTLAKF